MSNIQQFNRKTQRKLIGAGQIFYAFALMMLPIVGSTFVFTSTKKPRIFAIRGFYLGIFFAEINRAGNHE